MCKSVNIFVFLSYQCCAGALNHVSRNYYEQPVLLQHLFSLPFFTLKIKRSPENAVKIAQNKQVQYIFQMTILT